MQQLRETDPAIADILTREAYRQSAGLELIASENFASHAVIQAMGSTLTNKYAEGYPGKRYYGGCEVVDEAETLAIQRCLQLFGGDHANVQPHSGASANLAAYLAFMKPGDTLLGMNLTHGGHLTHGSPVNVSGQLYKPVAYGVREEDGRIDYDEIRELARRHRPRVLVAGASAYPRIIDFNTLAGIAREVEAILLVDMAHIAGLVAGGVHPSPVPYADIVTSTSHKTLRGPRSGFILCGAGHAKAIDKQVFPGLQGGPLMHIIAAKAVAFHEALQPEFRAYSARVVENAAVLGEALLERGLRLVSGGTDNHLLLVDLRDREITGKQAEEALERARITTNKNTVPGEKRSPFVTSGIRIGTAALTTRGMGVTEMRMIGGWIGDILETGGRADVIERVLGGVAELAEAFPIYRELWQEGSHAAAGAFGRKGPD
jgi:glycine hydroxymethyltransferase